MALGAVFKQCAMSASWSIKLVDIGFLEYSIFDFSVKHTNGIWLSESNGVRLAVAFWFVIRANLYLQGHLKPPVPDLQV